VRNLQPDTSYMFLVRAQNSHGLSLPSPVTSSIRTRGALPAVLVCFSVMSLSDLFEIVDTVVILLFILSNKSVIIASYGMCLSHFLYLLSPHFVHHFRD